MDCVCSEGKTKYLHAFEWGIEVGARLTGLCQELQSCWIFHTTVSRVYQEWSTTQKTSSQLVFFTLVKSRDTELQMVYHTLYLRNNGKVILL
jgi:hypothetical protein